jgi:methyl-accepting chemotaxis protein
MVSSVGGISIDLSANTSKFIAGFKKSADTVDRESKRMSNAVGGIGKSFKSLTGLIGSFGAGLAGGAAFAGLTSFTGLISSARAAIGRLDDIADRAKTSGIGTDLLQSLEHGAQQAGLEVADMGGALSFFAKGMGQAAEGTGRLYSGLLKLNPVLLQQILHAKDQEERLKLVADALDKTKDAAKRAALSAALFGDVDMARLFEGGAEAIDKMVQKAKDLDQVVSADDIKRAGEYDTALNDIEKSTGKAVDALVINLGPALVGASTGFRIGIEAIGDYITKVEKLDTTIDNFRKDPSRANLADVIFGPKGNGNLFDFLRGADEAKQSFEDLRQEAIDTGKELAELYERKAEGFAVDDDINKTAGHLELLNRKLHETAETARNTFDELRHADLAALNAAGEPPGPNKPKLPTVRYRDDQGPAGLDPDVAEKIADAIEKETEATKQVAARASDVYRGVQQFDTHSAGYFDRLGSQIDSGLQSVGRALSYNVPSGGGYATGGAGSFKYSGNNSSGSWAGRQMTLGGNAEADTAYYNAAFGGRANRVGGVEDASSISSAGTTSGAINVNIVVKPVMEGSRLSGQSSAEIKQAASAGANAALRAYYGR